MALGYDALLETQRNAILVSAAAIAFVVGAMIVDDVRQHCDSGFPF